MGGSGSSRQCSILKNQDILSKYRTNMAELPTCSIEPSCAMYSVIMQYLASGRMSSLWSTAPPSFWCHRWLRLMPLWMLSLMLLLLLRLMSATAAGRGGGHSLSSKCTSFYSAIARVCRLKLCDIKVWTLAEVSWIEIHESKVNKIIVTWHMSEHRLYMFVAIVSHWMPPGDLCSHFTILHPAINKTAIKLF